MITLRRTFRGRFRGVWTANVSIDRLIGARLILSVVGQVVQARPHDPCGVGRLRRWCECPSGPDQQRILGRVPLKCCLFDAPVAPWRAADSFASQADWRLQLVGHSRYELKLARTVALPSNSNRLPTITYPPPHVSQPCQICAMAPGLPQFAAYIPLDSINPCSRSKL